MEARLTDKGIICGTCNGLVKRLSKRQVQILSILGVKKQEAGPLPEPTAENVTIEKDEAWFYVICFCPACGRAIEKMKFSYGQAERLGLVEIYEKMKM